MEPTGSADLAILIFSKRDRSCETWMTLTILLSKAIEAHLEDSMILLDSITSGADTASPTRTDQSGRVCEIRASIPNSRHDEFVASGGYRRLREEPKIQEFEDREDLEVMFQPLELYLAHKTPGLAVFDMDSTLIQQEVIDELARSVGRYEQVAAVTEAAMRGELDFEESLRQRVAQLKGISTDIWDHLKKNVITFTPGAADLVKVLKHFGWKTAVLSGGFTPLAYWLKDTLGLDYAYANQLSTDESGSVLSGTLLPNTSIVGASVKRDMLLKLAAENNIPLVNTIAVGDGSNDLLMMNAAGFGVAFNAKPKVQLAAPSRLNTSSLLDIAHVLSYIQQDINNALLPKTVSTI